MSDEAYEVLDAADSFFAVTGMPLHVQRIRIVKAVRMHAHTFAELVLAVAGYAMHGTRTREYSISRGDTLIIWPGEIHEYKDTRDLEVINVVFDKARMNVPSDDLAELPGYHALFSLDPTWRRRHRARSRFRLSEEELRHVEGLLGTLETELGRRRGAYRCMARGLFLQTLVFLSRAYSRTRQSDSASLLRIGRVLGFMEKQYEQPVEMKQLLAIAHMSESTLLRTFRRAVHVTPIEYLIRLRVRKATSLLTGEGLTVTETAFRVGFSDSNYFSRQFKRVMGVSPSEYKRRLAGLAPPALTAGGT
ncbi:MAG: helix-turn-helix domain-containing protein [Kiritimatiellae bacterium]|nr:helix-turn-helix domain-containing protein [Kiritimatiellia bacterium]